MRELLELAFNLLDEPRHRSHIAVQIGRWLHRHCLGCLSAEEARPQVEAFRQWRDPASPSFDHAEPEHREALEHAADDERGQEIFSSKVEGRPVIGVQEADLETFGILRLGGEAGRSEEHTSELQSLMRISYAVFCLKKKKKQIVTQSLTELLK